MNKHSIITTMAIIVIIIPVLYGVWGILSVEQIQLRTPNEDFSYFEMAHDEKIQMCNPMPFFVSFNGMKIETFYTEDIKGIFEMGNYCQYYSMANCLVCSTGLAEWLYLPH